MQSGGGGGTIVVCHWLCQCPSWRVLTACPFRQTADHREARMLLPGNPGRASGTQRTGESIAGCHCWLVQQWVLAWCCRTNCALISNASPSPHPSPLPRCGRGRCPTRRSINRKRCTYRVHHSLACARCEASARARAPSPSGISGDQWRLVFIVHPCWVPLLACLAVGTCKWLPYPLQVEHGSKSGPLTQCWSRAARVVASFRCRPVLHCWTSRQWHPACSQPPNPNSHLLPSYLRQRNHRSSSRLMRGVSRVRLYVSAARRIASACVG